MREGNLYCVSMPNLNSPPVREYSRVRGLHITFAPSIVKAVGNVIFRNFPRQYGTILFDYIRSNKNLTALTLDLDKIPLPNAPVEQQVDYLAGQIGKAFHMKSDYCHDTARNYISSRSKID